MNSQCKHITSQAEYDAAIADYQGECLHLVDAEVQEISGDVRVSLLGTTKVTRVSDSATIQRVSGSATIQDVYGSATIQDVSDSATIQRVSGSATIQRVSGSATIQRVSGSATIQDVSGSATIRINGSARILKATRYTVIHKGGDQCTVSSAGTVIEVPNLTGGDPLTWCDYYGLDVVDGYVTVYKAVNSDLVSGHGTAYPIGQTVTAPDWEPTAECGNGLHFSPTPRHTLSYVTDSDSVRFLACRVPVDGLVTLGDKVKAASAEVLHETDRAGNPIELAAAASTP